MMNQLEYCLQVIENAKSRGNTSCQVPIWAEHETIDKLAELGYPARQIGFDQTEQYHHLKIYDWSLAK